MNSNQFTLTSGAFENGKAMPTKYANVGVSGGQNISIPLSWKNSPKDTKSFAVAIVDRHPIANNWVHWLVIDIPSDVTSISEGASLTDKMPTGSKELDNTFGTQGYGGPQPPKGSGPHKYEITIYALNIEKLGRERHTTLSAFLKSIEGKIIAQAKTVGIFER